MNREELYNAIDKAICDRWYAVYQRLNPEWSRWLPWYESGSVEVECLAKLRNALWVHYTLGRAF